jgi:hypothetical protein
MLVNMISGILRDLSRRLLDQCAGGGQIPQRVDRRR